jgi:hypothetical protein
MSAMTMAFLLLPQAQETIPELIIAQSLIAAMMVFW